MKAGNKIQSLDQMVGIRSDLRSRRSVLVFTNGCFDLLHIGHLRYLEAARELGDFLLVAVNSDASVRAIKGPRRPLVAEQERAELVAGLHCVDAVLLFDSPDPLPVIEQLVPDVLVKGADWPLDRIVGAELVEAHGGRVERIPVVAGHSTTDLIRRLRRMPGSGEDLDPAGKK